MFYLILIQGILEAFPVSSSLHLAFFNLKSGNDALMHFGSAFALLFIINKFIINRFKNLFSGFFSEVIKFFLFIFPTIILGFLFSKRSFSLYYSLIFNIIAAVFMVAVDLYQQRNKSLSSLSFFNSFLIGSLVSLALVPGFSRLGISFTAFRLFSLRRIDSLVLSLAIGIPISLGASLIGFIQGDNITYSLIFSSIFSGFLNYAFLFITFKLINSWWIYGLYRVCISFFFLFFCC